MTNLLKVLGVNILASVGLIVYDCKVSGGINTWMHGCILATWALYVWDEGRCC